MYAIAAQRNRPSWKILLYTVFVWIADEKMEIVGKRNKDRGIPILPR